MILISNFYISIAKDLSFHKRLFEMVAISLGIAGLTFLLGVLVRIVFHVEI